MKILYRSNLSFKNELNSEKFYESLHSLSDFRGYFKDCISLDELPYGTRIKIICAKVLKYLETINKNSYNQDDPYDVCLLLNYWVYSRLFDILQYKGEHYVHIAYGKLQSKWTDFLDDKSYHKLCKPITNMVNHNDWRKRKELYEYYVDYSPIKESLVYFPERCEEFYHYVESKKTLYEHFKKRCTSSEENICPKFYNDCIKYNPEKVLSTFKCQQDIMNKRKADERSVAQRGNIHSGREPISEDSSVNMLTVGASQNLSGKSQTADNVGNILLGVVATTMTSGALYRVNISSLLQINCTCLLISFNISP
ncbi:hypothetical protein PVMG_05744 [Plasmodium vivax Mauritania I]|uniref:CYIR protein n=1 Tax=Plasmodium vivax Mauritania I TaxID=1035515 RepID=A0A0J9T7F2_PLAVI|nr:hypothetical protein PVMG_05744 [Plasmodium vivax Mauritania I]